MLGGLLQPLTRDATSHSFLSGQAKQKLRAAFSSARRVAVSGEVRMQALFSIARRNSKLRYRHQWPPSVGRAWLVGVLTQLALPGVEMQMAPHTAARPHCRACTAMVILYRWIVVAATVAGSGGSASVLHAIFALIRSVCGVQLSSSAISIFFYGMLGFGSAFV